MRDLLGKVARGTGSLLVEFAETTIECMTHTAVQASKDSNLAEEQREKFSNVAHLLDSAKKE